MTRRSRFVSFLFACGHAFDRAVFYLQDLVRRRSLMRYTSKPNRPLHAMLNEVLADYGFTPADASDRPDIATWRKPLGPTLKAEISITLHPALAPHAWSLEPTVMIDSAYVAHWQNALRLYRDFYPAMSGYRDPETLQVLRFHPAHIRWQEKLELKYPSLQGSLDTIDALRDSFAEVCEHYIVPVLAQLRDPLALAEFQLRAETEFPSTRIGWSEPRYQVSNPTISTALLFDEAGETARAVAFLEQAREELSRLWAGRDPAVTQAAYGRLDRLLEHLRARARVGA